MTEGASTAGGVVSKASLAIDAGSTSIHLLRAHYLDKAKNAYEQATAYRKSVCKEVPKKNNGQRRCQEHHRLGQVLRASGQM